MDDNQDSQDNASQVGFHKFDWIAAIRHCQDKQLSDGLKYVLTHIALVYLRDNGHGVLYARQSTIAEELNTDIRQVQRAYAVAKRLGYFVKVKRAARGRGLHAPDSYRLAIPDLPDNMSARSDLPDKPADLPDKSADLPDKSADLPDIANSVTCDSDTIKGGKQGIEKGGEKGTTPPPALQGDPPLAALALTDPSGSNGQALPLNDADVAHPVTWQEFLLAGYPTTPIKRPSKYCDKHPDGTPVNCGGCKDRREFQEEWDGAYTWWKDYDDFVREQIRNCKRCCAGDGKYRDESGNLLWCEHPDSDGFQYLQAPESTDSAT
jgi:hypothetical protein